MHSIVYILTGDEYTPYADMLHLSVISVTPRSRGWNKVLLCDSVVGCDASFEQLRRLFDEVIVVDVSGPPAYRSRYIKTSIPRYVDGPWLFLDVDTLVVDDISGVLGYADTIAIADELCVLGEAATTPPPHYVHVAEYLGVPTQVSRMVNSGVMWCGAGGDASKLFESWHRLWLHATGSSEFRDQATLGLAVDETGVDVVRLDQRFNALVRISERLRRNAAILHVQASVSDMGRGSVYARLVRAVSINAGDVDESQISNALRWRLPIINGGRARHRYEAGDYLGAACRFVMNRVGIAR